MRFLAASLFLSAAFDWPVPWVDRAGVAALGLFCLALTVGAALPGRRSARPSLNGQTLAGGSDQTADQVAAYQAWAQKVTADASDALAPTEDALEAWAKRY